MRKQVNNLPDSAWQPFSHLFETIEVPSGTILLREGQIAKRAFYIEKGCLRSWFNKDGKDITFQFFVEGQGVSSIESFRTQTPSLYNVETIEPAILHRITHDDFEFILNHSKPIRRSVERHIFERLVYYQKLFLSHIKDSPQERYEELLKNSPEILLRVPQYYIASYLGISPVHLSRVRSRVLKKQAQIIS